MTATKAKPAARFAATKVPQLTLMFWGLKLLTTGMGEAISDAMGQQNVAIAAAVGLFGCVLALYLQMRQQEYKPAYYWFAVMMVAVFGTMAADAIHDGASIGYEVTTPLFAALTALVFWRWHRAEGTLDVHFITTRRRERYYWLAVLCTFALGTAAGDLTALALSWGFWPSALLFGVLFAIPAVGWWRFGWNPIFSFWFAYVITRPLGASFADGFSKTGNGGLSLGDPLVAVIELVVFVALVGWLTVKDRSPAQPRRAHASHEPPRLGFETE
ncbi:MAG: hypothetical protein J2O48_09835 [Solirubrobacterales bacterium]|nr:hypothetical protein [Solirubrobacterales bacterium]